ncbi:1,4-dihydroxy-2-naphthoyl-CoA hydrolase [Reichenbachiella faecimaris]|uniref:1,4-dihydroxy-2-naphthoyl-CoA hydrolase n=2 Tax=Reichenbachiella faecimaris TaxID=692418 RepID=A0A1W2GR34_REIFA|nr:1,4-dihydroxy-2-naphthoyl-CoA hydrolase [Reichenbachiella faecimaris]
MKERMFLPTFTLEGINAFSKNTMTEHIGIEFTEIGEDFVKATMPVDSRTVQPFRMLHGGASVVLAESLGSVAATMTVDPNEKYCVGLDINANHIKAVKNGIVEGIARPLHVGKKTQVWEIKITNEEKQLVCVSRITMAVIDKK